MSVSFVAFFLTIGLAAAEPVPPPAETPDRGPESERAGPEAAGKDGGRKATPTASDGPSGTALSKSPAGGSSQSAFLLAAVLVVVLAIPAYFFLVRPQRVLSRSADRLTHLLRIRSVERVLEQFFAEKQRLGQMDQRYQERERELGRMQSVAEYR